MARKKQKQMHPLTRILLAIAVVISTVYGYIYTTEDLERPSGDLTAATEVHFIDVGQGDAALLLSGGEAVLIDGGPGGSEKALLDYLADAGVEEFRAIIATHPHEDHLGGLDGVLKTYPVETLYMPNKPATTAIFNRVLDYAEEQETEIVVPEIGDVFTFASGATLTFLSPAADAKYDNVNNYSIVTMFEAGGERVLFTGDAEKPVERELMQRGADLDCDILKMGHHGSSTSSGEEFVRKTGADTVIISCGKNNDYGHPHRETIALIEKLGLEAHITAEEGSIVYTMEPDEKEAAA